MEQLKVKKKDVLVLNMIIFLGLSFVFLYLQYAYSHHLSPFSMAYLKKSFELFWYALIPLIICAGLVWKHNRLSVPLYAFCAALVSYKVIEGLFIEFNKIIVIALFFYVVISYFYYQMFDYYLSLASLNPNYSSSDLFDQLLKEIPCSWDQDGTQISGLLTNWDDEGCFVKLNGTITGDGPTGQLIIEFKGRRFIQKGEIVSLNKNGVGLKFGKSNKDLNLFNWAEFNELVYELGFRPERLR